MMEQTLGPAPGRPRPTDDVDDERAAVAALRASAQATTLRPWWFRGWVVALTAMFALAVGLLLAA